MENYHCWLNIRKLNKSLFCTEILGVGNSHITPSLTMYHWVRHLVGQIINNRQGRSILGDLLFMSYCVYNIKNTVLVITGQRRQELRRRWKTGLQSWQTQKMRERLDAIGPLLKGAAKTIKDGHGIKWILVRVTTYFTPPMWKISMSTLAYSFLPEDLNCEIGFDFRYFCERSNANYS